MKPAAPASHITDDYMNDRIGKAKTYTLVVLRPTTKYFDPSSRPIVWEHGRRNMALQAAGIMPIVCPVGDEEISGIGIFNTDPEQARIVMADDPGVRAGIFTFEVHPAAVSPVMHCRREGFKMPETAPRPDR